MFFRPGELDQKIDFKREVKVDDGIGGKTLSLTSIKSRVWAHVRALSGKETERFDKVNAEVMMLFVVRYRTDIRENDRIIWEGEQYNIRYIPPKKTRAMYSEFYAEKGVAQ